MACQHLQAATSNGEILGRAWGAEYDRLNPDQQLFAKRVMDNVMYEARLGNLTGCTTIVH